METSDEQPARPAALILRQFALLAVTGASLWWALEVDYCAPDAAPLWPAALIGWLAQSMFWLGWRCHDLKLLFLLAGGWVGVAASAAVLIIFVGAAVAATGDRTAIRIVGAIALLFPLYLLPRLAALWPSRRPPAGALPYLGRALFVVLQYAGIGAVIASIVRLCGELPPI